MECRKEPTASLCSLERVVRLPRLQRGLWTAGTEGDDAGGGTRVLPPGRRERSEWLAGKEGRADGSARAGTDKCWREVGTSSPPATKGTGTSVPLVNPPTELPVAGPNAQAQRRREKRQALRDGRSPAVRCSALLGLWASAALNRPKALAATSKASPESHQRGEESNKPDEESHQRGEESDQADEETGKPDEESHQTGGGGD